MAEISTRMFYHRFTVLNEAKQLPDKFLASTWVNIRTPTGNSGDIFFAESKQDCEDPGGLNRYSLPADETESFQMVNLKETWFYGSASGDVFDLAAIIEERFGNGQILPEVKGG